MATKTPASRLTWDVTFQNEKTENLVKQMVRATDPDDAVPAAEEVVRGSLHMSVDEFRRVFRLVRVVTKE
jgi:hypothetical protein